MDRPNSANSNPVKGSKSSVSGPFGYQTRLLERTASVRTGNASTRSNSISGVSILTNPTGGSSSLASTRRWNPTHRVANSMDAVRGKWEERSRDAAPEDSLASSSQVLGDLGRSSTTSLTSSDADRTLSRNSSYRPSTPPTVPIERSESQRTPTYLKRQTIPAPIIASPLSPNSTGISVESDPSTSSFSSTSQRIHLPSSASTPKYSANQSSESYSPRKLDFLPSRRSNTLDTWLAREQTSMSSPINTAPPESPTRSQRPKSLSGSSSSRASETVSLDPITPSKANSSGTSRPPAIPHGDNNFGDISNRFDGHSIPSSPNSVMSPTPYRSSYLQNKKATYGESLLGTRRKFGNHLPRIASGDGEENVKTGEIKKPSETPSMRSRRERRLKALVNRDLSPSKREAFALNVASVDDVTGVPGRLRLSKNHIVSVPLPSSRLTRGLWADTQRQFIQAYEYLCHVGEAQQWMEGCLDEELGFGVVEMDDGLRNGIVLAKLVRVFEGPDVVRRIYEAPKLDFRHSDNINIFLDYVKGGVCLPDCFIFELTDLYEKKNIPKVIYCIHALSHLMARRGMTKRIGNLLGRLQFSDDQLQRTHKDLKSSGVSMPNFSNVGRELAKEINEEPEVEVETDDERRDRLLLENEASIIKLQAYSRGYIARQERINMRNSMNLTKDHVQRFQAYCAGALMRRRVEGQRASQNNLTPWVIAIQSVARARLAQRRWDEYLGRIQRISPNIPKMQAQIRGVLQRRRFARLRNALRSSTSTVKLQSIARAVLTRRKQNEVVKSFAVVPVQSSITRIQAQARATLIRRVTQRRATALEHHSLDFIALQAHCRGLLMRRRLRAQMSKLEDATSIVIRIQAACRTFLSRKRLLTLIRGLRRATPIIVSFQSRARANIARQRHLNVNKALTEIKTLKAVGGFQSLARAALARNRHRNINKKLEFVAPDVTDIQARARGALIRRDYIAWRDHLRSNQGVATILQAMLRGTLQRRRFRQKMQYFRDNLSKVVKIQSLFRAKETREQYRQLTMGKNVTVGTIKNFVHLLDDSEADFQEEIKVERLRKKVVESIRENQALESALNDLDVKIGLVVENVKSFEEVVKSRRHDSVTISAARSSLLAQHGDPFSGPNTVDQDARRKLELYQQLFYLLQTHAQYLSRFFDCMSREDTSEKNRRFTERVVLTLFGYGQDRREDFLLLKLFQLSIRDEIAYARNVHDIVQGHPMYMSIAIHYIRPKQTIYARETFQQLICDIANSHDLDLEVDPSVIHRARLEKLEMTSDLPVSGPKDIPFLDAIADPDTRAEYIRHLQVLRWWTEVFVKTITESTRKLPYSVRYLARETLEALKEKFPDAPQTTYSACIGRMLYYRYINPAIVTPETFDIVSETLSISARKNLAQISTILTRITNGQEFGDDMPIYVPVNEFVKKEISQMSAWLIEVADVPDAETHFHAHEFLDATVQPKSIYITPNEIYSMHSLVSQNLEYLAPDPDDTLRIVIRELGGVPNLGSDELKDARDMAITLELSNRFIDVQDPQAEEKTLWVQAKRGVLAILRVQPAGDLLESLLKPVTDEDEMIWEDIVDAEIANEQMRQMPRRQPSQAAPEAAYRLDDIRSLNFRAVKALAISFLLKLEEQGKISRVDGFQGILNAIAGDVRSKHRKRIQRQQEMESMNEALCHLGERKKIFQEKIDSYRRFAESSVSTMTKNTRKKRFTLPFTQQYYHLRSLQKSGQKPKFGSYLYPAKQLYDKGILLSIDQYSPRQFDRIQFTMSSNTTGVFTLLLESTLAGPATKIASEDITLDDLLHAKYEKQTSLPLFGGLVKVNFTLFLAQINKKFYARL